MTEQADGSEGPNYSLVRYNPAHTDGFPRGRCADVANIVDRETVSFAPFKFPFPDGIIPVMLHEGLKHILPWMKKITTKYCCEFSR